MKNYLSLGTVLSKEQAQNVNGGVSVSCSNSNGHPICLIKCSNGKSILIRGCASANASSINGREVVIACGTLYRCGI